MLKMHKQWTAVCDFDGTISTQDVTDLLLERFADPVWQAIEADWKNNIIDSRECLSRQVDLVSASLPEIEELADTVKIDPYFKDFVAFCRQLNIRVVVVSDGLDLLIKRVLSNHGLSDLPVFANSLTRVDERSYRLEMPYSAAGCHAGSAVCKCAVMRQLVPADSNNYFFFVGDGQSDYCAAKRQADAVAAKSSLLEYLKNSGRTYVSYETFKEVREFLNQIALDVHPVLKKQLELELYG